MKPISSELNIRSKRYIYDNCNPYQKIIYQQLALQVDELQQLKKLKEESANPADIEKRIYKSIGVLEYFESRFKAFEAVSTPKNIYS